MAPDPGDDAALGAPDTGLPLARKYRPMQALSVPIVPLQALPVQILLGIYLGILTGIIPALVAGVLGFVFKYFTGVSIPGLGVIVLALAVAGVNGGLLALNDPTIRASDNATALLVAIIVVLMLSLYAHSKGDKLGGSLPRHITLRTLTERTLSSDVVELVGGRGQVRVRVAGEVGNMEGYPPLPADLRTEIGAGEWTFPADVPLAELETRLADRLRTDYDLSDVSVRLDERARATVYAAPPTGGLSKRVPQGERAVSIPALLPTGLARGDEVRVRTDTGTVTGTVVSARSSGGEDDEPQPAVAGDVATDGGEEPTESVPTTAPVTAGGDGRLTLSVSRDEASTLLAADRGRAIVLSRGTRREFELVSLLRRTGKRFRRVTVQSGGPLDGTTIGEAGVRDQYGVVILAVRDDRWRIAPRGDTELAAGQELFAVGARDALTAFEEAAA
jgi:hypothetical protein